MEQSARGAGMLWGEDATIAFLQRENLSAIVRVVGLFLFGRLYLFGQGVGLPSLPYLLCAATQVAAAGLVLAIPAAQWRSKRTDSVEADDRETSVE